MRNASAALESRRGGSGNSALWFRLGPDQETIVRFLEQGEDIHWANCHEIPVEGRQWGRDEPCLDQNKEGAPCPGCEAGLPVKFKGYINVLWEDAPVFKRDGAGKLVKEQDGKTNVIVGTKPQVAVWGSGIRLFEDLDEIDTNYRGLASRKFRVKRTGTGFDTRYRMSPADVDSGPQPMTQAEQLLADGKYDLAPYVTPKTYEAFEADMRGTPLPAQQATDNAAGQAQSAPNPFLRNRPAQAA